MKKVVSELKNKDLKVLLFCFISVFFIAFLGSYFVGDIQKDGWYESIKPSLAPPNYVFPIVWTFLYVLISFSIYYSWKSGKVWKYFLFFYSINLVLNSIWSPLYFRFRSPLFAFFDLILLWFSIVFLMILSWQHSRKSFWLLVPYFLWVSFAGFLNWTSI